MTANAQIIFEVSEDMLDDRVVKVDAVAGGVGGGVFKSSLLSLM